MQSLHWASIWCGWYTQRWIYFWKWNQECEMSVFTLHFIHFCEFEIQILPLLPQRSTYFALKMFSHFSIPAIKRLFLHIKYCILRICCCWYWAIHFIHTLILHSFLVLMEHCKQQSRRIQESFSFKFSESNKRSFNFLCFERRRVNMIEILRVKRDCTCSCAHFSSSFRILSFEWDSFY